MTDKQEVIEALNAMPENVSLDEIIEGLRIMNAVRRGQTAIAEGRTKTQEEVERLVESWATKWAAR
jgi:predicted transcriptional regulator